MNLQEKQPFYKRHRFVGQFVLDDMTTDPVDIVVEFNELEGGPDTTSASGAVATGARAPGSGRPVWARRPLVPALCPSPGLAVP